MSDMLNDILMCCKIDLKHLIQFKRCLENSAERKTMTILSVETIKAISAIVSKIHTQQHPESEYIEIIIDTLLFAVRDNNNEFGRIESELGNLTLKILACIEHNAKFRILFCKLLSLINIISSHSINVWQLLARPILNIFINKRFDHVYMEEALREFSKVSKNSKPLELVRVIKENQDIAKGFTLLVRAYGDFLVQMNILELLFVLSYDKMSYDKSLIKIVFCCCIREMSELLKYLTFSDFRKDSRIFLNAFNKSLGSGKKVFSLKCSKFYVGNTELLPPTGIESIWTDLNQDSQRLSIFCADFQLNPRTANSDILQLPVKKVERIQIKFKTVSNEDYYWIVMKIRNTSEILHFKGGSEVICEALVSVNQRKEVLDFVQAIDELSEKIRWYPMEKMEANDTHNSDYLTLKNSEMENLKSPFWQSKSYRVKKSDRLPLVFGSEDKSDYKQLMSSSQISSTSSVLSVEKELNTKSKFDDNINAKARKSRSKGKNNGKKFLRNPNLQVNEISSSVLESERLIIDSSFKSSMSSHISSRKKDLRNYRGVLNNIQLDTNESEKGIRKKSLLNIQDTIESSSNNENKKFDFNDSTKNKEETNQIKRNCRRSNEEWTNSFDDFLPLEFQIKESNKENLPETVKYRILSKNKSGSKMYQQQDNKFFKQQYIKPKPKEREKREHIYKTSLLDPNGYSYKRWQLQTTSERSNFWLNKLKNDKTKTSKPIKDVFHFSEEDDSDGSNVFRKKTRKKKTAMSIDKMKNEFEKFRCNIKGGKLQKDNNRKPSNKESNFPKAVVKRKSQSGVRSGRGQR